MKANKVTAEDVKNIGVGGQLVVELPNYLACVAAKGGCYLRKESLPKG